MVQSFYLQDESGARIPSQNGASIRLESSGGEAVMQANLALRNNILKMAEAILQRDAAGMTVQTVWCKTSQPAKPYCL